MFGKTAGKSEMNKTEEGEAARRGGSGEIKGSWVGSVSFHAIGSTAWPRKVKSFFVWVAVIWAFHHLPATAIHRPSLPPLVLARVSPSPRVSPPVAFVAFPSSGIRRPTHAPAAIAYTIILTA